MFFSDEPKYFWIFLTLSAVMWANFLLFIFWSHRSAFEFCVYIQPICCAQAHLFAHLYIMTISFYCQKTSRWYFCMSNAIIITAKRQILQRCTTKGDLKIKTILLLWRCFSLHLKFKPLQQIHIHTLATHSGWRSGNSLLVVCANHHATAQCRNQICDCSH